MRKSRKRWVTWLIASAVMALSVMIGSVSLAATDLSSEVYLAQQGSSTCTLASAAMMVRARFYKSNNSLWKSITESSIRSKAWIEGSGLRHSWSYSVDNNSVSVAHSTVSGISVSSLKSLLNSHPEGIVLYCGKLPHAVFLTDYDGDTFYCADPIQSYSGKRISLAASYLGKKYGSQAGVLNNVTAYWYISSYTISSNTSSAANNPFGSFDSVTTSAGKIGVHGWAADLDAPNSAIWVHFYTVKNGNRKWLGAVLAGDYRPDVCKDYPTLGKNHGFNAIFNTDVDGTVEVEAHGINVGSTGVNLMLSNSPQKVSVDKDTVPPTISNIKITEQSATGYTITCNVGDNVLLTS